jgi:hypothetical protein
MREREDTQIDLVRNNKGWSCVPLMHGLLARHDV